MVLKFSINFLLTSIKFTINGADASFLLTTIFCFIFFLYLFICKQHTNLFILFYEVYISMRKTLTSIQHWEVDLQMLKDCLIIQLSKRLMYTYISQFVQNLDDVIPESINNVQIHYL